MILVRKADSSASERIALLDQHLECAFQAVGALDELIRYIEVATRTDGIEDFRSQLLISIHPNIIASVAPIGERRCRWSLSGIAVF